MARRSVRTVKKIGRSLGRAVRDGTVRSPRKRPFSARRTVGSHRAEARSKGQAHPENGTRENLAESFEATHAKRGCPSEDSLSVP